MSNTLAALVTGASTGIGQAIAVQLADDGYSMMLVGRNQTGLEETKGMIQSAGGSAEIITADLLKREDIEHLCAQVKSKLSRLDVLVHAAGVWHDATSVYAGIPLVDTPSNQIEEVLTVGITAPMLLTRALLPLMIPHKRGKIITISGTFSTGGAGWLHYYVSKLALEYFTVGLSEELREHEIQVNCISPSDTDTEALRKFFPEDAETAIKPEEVSNLATFLASVQADHITGQCIVIRNKAVD